MKNVGERAAGTIVAALFLKQFVPPEIPWAHLDIAGTAWTDKDSGAAPKGATGFGVRTLYEIARRWPLGAVSTRTVKKELFFFFFFFFFFFYKNKMSGSTENSAHWFPSGMPNKDPASREFLCCLCSPFTIL